MKLKVKNVTGRRLNLPGGIKAFVGREVEVEDSEDVRRMIIAKMLELLWAEQAEQDGKKAIAEAAALDQAELEAEKSEKT